MKRLVADRGICAYDLCAFNADLGFADRVQRLLHRLGELDVVPIDSQTYYYVRFDQQSAPAATISAPRADLNRADLNRVEG